MVFLDDHTRDSYVDGDYDETLPAAINNSGLKFERESQQDEWRAIAEQRSSH